MDFVIKLLKLEDMMIKTKYDNILITINKFIKYAYLISYNERFIVK